MAVVEGDDDSRVLLSLNFEVELVVLLDEDAVVLNFQWQELVLVRLVNERCFALLFSCVEFFHLLSAMLKCLIEWEGSDLVGVVGGEGGEGVGVWGEAD
jgi:hypothetical protein